MQLAERIGACFGECGHRLPDGVLESSLPKFNWICSRACGVLDRFVEEGQADIDRIIKEPAFGDWIATGQSRNRCSGGCCWRSWIPHSRRQVSGGGGGGPSGSVSLSEIVPRFLFFYSIHSTLF